MLSAAELSIGRRIAGAARSDVQRALWQEPPWSRRSARALTPAGQAGNYPALLVDGVVGGVWHQRRSGGKLAITVEPLRELTAAQRRQLDDEAGLVGAVMEATATLTVGTVTVGAHA